MSNDLPEQTPGGGAIHKMVSVALNALRWIEADEGLSKVLDRGPPAAENLLDFACGPFARADIQASVARYRRASAVDGGLFAIPTNDRLSRGIIVPLHNAKAEFVLGHCLSCIGLCGVVAEVLCMLRFDAAHLECGGMVLNEAKQADLWGRPFEQLFQGQRIGALAALGLIDEPTRALLKSVASIRNKYMHIYRQEARNEEEDSLVVYRDTCRATVAILGIGLEGSKLVLHPDIVRLLER